MTDTPLSRPTWIDKAPSNWPEDAREFYRLRFRIHQRAADLAWQVATTEGKPTDA